MAAVWLNIHQSEHSIYSLWLQPDITTHALTGHKIAGPLFPRHHNFFPVGFSSRTVLTIKAKMVQTEKKEKKRRTTNRASFLCFSL